VCALDISICADGDGSVPFIHLRPRSISLFSTFVRSSASNPIDIDPSACFCFWVTLAGVLRLGGAGNEYFPCCMYLFFYVTHTHVHTHDQPLSPLIPSFSRSCMNFFLFSIATLSTLTSTLFQHPHAHTYSRLLSTYAIFPFLSASLCNTYFVCIIVLS